MSLRPRLFPRPFPHESHPSKSMAQHRQPKLLRAQPVRVDVVAAAAAVAVAVRMKQLEPRHRPRAPTRNRKSISMRKMQATAKSFRPPRLWSARCRVRRVQHRRLLQLSPLPCRHPQPCPRSRRRQLPMLLREAPSQQRLRLLFPHRHLHQHRSVARPMRRCRQRHRLPPAHRLRLPDRLRRLLQSPRRCVP